MNINQRTILFAKYIIDTGATVRETAVYFGYGKSTVHDNLVSKLPKLDNNLFTLVKEILDRHYAVRHLRGGESTKNKFLKINQSSSSAESGLS